MGNGNGKTMLAVPRRAALLTIAVLVAAASAASFAESYRGLYDWAARHGLTGAWAYMWPVQVDVFIAVGELALFVALTDRWAPRSRAAAWAVTGIGVAVSVAGNVGHAAGHSLTTRATAAVPPLAAALALAVALGVLKRVVEAHHESVPAAVPAAVPAQRKLPQVQEIQDRRHCGQRAAQVARAEVQLDRRTRGGGVVRHPAAPGAQDVPAAAGLSSAAGAQRSRGAVSAPPPPPAAAPAGPLLAPPSTARVPAGDLNGQAHG